MRIAVISDTHLRQPTPWLGAVFDRYLAKADLLLHCGDTTSQALWSWFGQHPDFHAVAGNMDDWDLASHLEQRLIVRPGGLAVGLAHGFGFPGRELWREVAGSFGPGLDLVCFGHTHEPLWEHGQGVHVVNPGSLRQGPRASLAMVQAGPEGVENVEFIRPDILGPDILGPDIPGSGV